MAVVLVLRPWGLLGRRPAEARGTIGGALHFASAKIIFPLVVALALVPVFSGGYALVLLTDVLVFALFAVSLHFLLGPGGMVSFGHAAYFGLGAYGAALLVLRAGLPMELALIARPARSCRRRGPLRLVLRPALRHLLRDADARIRADRLVGRVPVGRDDRRLQRLGRDLAGSLAWFAERLLLRRRCCCRALGIAALWRIVASPFGHALRARAIRRCARKRSGSTCARSNGPRSSSRASFAGLAGALYAFSKGSISPETLSVPRSVDGLVMVLLGGVQIAHRPGVGRSACLPGSRTRYRARSRTGAPPSAR